MACLIFKLGFLVLKFRVSVKKSDSGSVCREGEELKSMFAETSQQLRSPCPRP